MTSDYLEKHGFKKPILLEKKDGLGIIVPCRDEINLSQIENIVGMEQTFKLIFLKLI